MAKNQNAQLPASTSGPVKINTLGVGDTFIDTQGVTQTVERVSATGLMTDKSAWSTWGEDEERLV